MVDVTWLSDQAQTIHDLFVHVFYAFATVLLLIGVVCEYFKLPLGGNGTVLHLVGRAIVAAILLQSYPEMSNTIADLADALAKQLGDLNQIKYVLAKFAEKFHTLNLSWISYKDWAIMVISYVLFFLLYLSVFIANAGIIFGWTLLYVFSPLLIVFFILPSTAQMTSALYRSIFELCAWKIVWSVLATLLWSFALSTINKPESNTNFITVLVLNLILAASLLLTPTVVHALMGQGISGISSQLGGVGAAASLLNPGARVASVAKKGENYVTGFASSKAKGLKEKFFSSDEKSKKPGKSSTPSSKSGLKSGSPSQIQMPEPPAWVTQPPPNMGEPPAWMQSRLQKEKQWEPKK